MKRPKHWRERQGGVLRGCEWKRRDGGACEPPVPSEDAEGVVDVEPTSLSLACVSGSEGSGHGIGLKPPPGVGCGLQRRQVEGESPRYPYCRSNGVNTCDCRWQFGLCGGGIGLRLQSRQPLFGT